MRKPLNGRLVDGVDGPAGGAVKDPPPREGGVMSLL
jgi:hypothetical protein